MRRLILASSCAAIVLGLASPAAARPTQPLITGRHNTLRAGMYAVALEGQRKPVQILRSICPKPGRRANCEAASVSLRTAIQDAVPVPIRWVGKERSGAGTFWELGPILRNGDTAHFNYRWRD